jgi:hypothetical protein
MVMPAKLKPSEYPSRRWTNKAKRKKYVLLSEELGFENPQSSQTGGDCDRPLTAAQAASFNP